MPLTEYSIKAADGITLYGQDWSTDQPARAVVCLVHGLGEHCGRYTHLIKRMNQKGLAVICFDLRGHGRSEGQRGHSPSFDLLMQDINLVIDEAQKRYPGLPHFLYGHSLGGNLVLNFGLRCKPAISGVIATSPGLRTTTPPAAWKTSLGKLMYNLMPTLSMNNGLDREGLSRDPEVVRLYVEDSLVHDKISARLGLDIIQNGEWAVQNAHTFSLPLLLIHGREDRIVTYKATEEFARRVNGDVTIRLWDGGYHELHNEPEKEDVIDFILNWLETHINGQ